MTSILLHAWTLHKRDNKYYIPYTHWVYLNEIAKYYDKICLLSPVNKNLQDTEAFEEIGMFKNVEVYELPYSEGYIDAVKHFFKYKRAYKELSSRFEVVYARYPIPFGWLQKDYFKSKKKIIHFVGDPVDTIVNNPNLSKIKKRLYITFFRPENYLFMRACRAATVYTNGSHIADKLKAKGIDAKPLVSSTLNDSDFFFVEKNIDREEPKIIYVGYLRKAKGVETVLKAFALLQKEKPKASLTIVGHGELEGELRKLVSILEITNVIFTGHIDNRKQLNELLRNNDIFCFASLSEGSPRVILEAMANGLAVVSTPVGSLPSTFEDGKEILFADFNNEFQFLDQLKLIIDNNDKFNMIRRSSYELVSNYKIENFLKAIFYEV